MKFYLFLVERRRPNRPFSSQFYRTLQYIKHWRRERELTGNTSGCIIAQSFCITTLSTTFFMKRTITLLPRHPPLDPLIQKSGFFRPSILLSIAPLKNSHPLAVFRSNLSLSVVSDIFIGRFIMGPTSCKTPKWPKTNGTQENTPFSGTFFHTLSHGVPHFVASGSFKNRYGYWKLC